MDNQESVKRSRMSLIGVLFAFMLSRGGVIASAVLFGVLLRLTDLRFDYLDVTLFSTIVVLWPLLEWFFHRYLLHEWTILPFHFTHGRHHHAPTPANGMPDSWVVVMYFVIAIVLWSLGVRRILSLYLAVLFMLAIYEFVHFSCHCNYRPMTSWGWAVRTNHLKHHNFDSTKFYSMLFPIIGRK